MNITKAQADKVIAALEYAKLYLAGHEATPPVIDAALSTMRGLAEDAEPTVKQSLTVHRSAEDYLRYRYGAYRGHFAWRELEEAYSQGRYDEEMLQGPNPYPGEEPSPQAAQTEAQEREAFEAWCVSRHLQPQLTTHEWTKITEYQPFIQAMWEGWQARAGRKG